VTATSSTKDKLDRLLSLPAGATHVANYKTENFVDVVKDATGGKGVDIVVDMVGQAHFTRNVDALAMDGRMIILSTISGLFFDTLLLWELLIINNRRNGLKYKPSSNPLKAPSHPGFDSAVPVSSL
jgi:NADPH:quinone reductase-like Zn-dependent oxidoreductase